ncbi:sporulation protein YqfC [Halanaerobacter jeridensis]|uniref:Sporulation protein YqfC n=1 Tax=Halanaerobacter jeridensis TaxID=706427 RepID=A0A939BQF1_9FIRM|nr:sporulation protein YqfC [Halanaerobacter jeridensis]MBM7556239.1 sporulation protein YqfC [Halanaerobacter jeridensis]
MEQDEIKTKLVKIFDLPQDVVFNLPVICLTGSLSLVLENHQGIHKYTTEVIKIKVKNGYIVIQGLNLKLDYLSEKKIAVIGQVKQLNFDCD